MRSKESDSDSDSESLEAYPRVSNEQVLEAITIMKDMLNKLQQSHADISQKLEILTAAQKNNSPIPGVKLALGKMKKKTDNGEPDKEKGCSI